VYQKWPPTLLPIPRRCPKRSAARNRPTRPNGPYRRFIEAEVAKGRNAFAIYQDIVEHHGYGGAYNAVKRFVGKLRPAATKVSCRFETEPGQDYVEYRVMLSPALESRLLCLGLP
jgi:hypothetical protein